ncbi:MAG: prolyl oligopeptidase family serine peptidase [Butyrivibrio sp.]|nr:prolyl oligopeptidase family serine peptidase [Butyrivibrio sp.]
MGNMYYQVIDVTDFGPYITKVILAMPRVMDKAELSKDLFNVYVTVKDRFGDVAKVPKSFAERDILVPSEGEREITGIYPCDIEGNEQKSGRFIALELAYGPIYKCSSAIMADITTLNAHEYYTFSDYKITQVRSIGSGAEMLSDLLFDKCAGIYNPKKDRFKDYKSEDEEKVLRYGYYVPELNGGKKPLIVWLHGAGEGGTQTCITYTGNKVTELTETWVQDKFDGVFILVPQCPTMWLDDGSGKYGDSGNSKYVQVLKNTIDQFISRYSDVIDMDRIYVGGDSNGGFMTMRMIMDYPDYFAAAFPICEAMLDERIDELHISKMKDMPIWFTHAANDPIVVPDKYAVPTYERLIKAGASNVHFTYWDKIVDIHAGFKDAAGNPYEYLGHFAWIPMLNDDCKLDYNGEPVKFDGKEVTLIEWLSKQKK